ncbi:MAG: N-6 DNA methylase [Verrucomicrobiales bacterium]|nr:N-6 DNA methylase [Verrucomicrobiales bacterium]
MSKPKIARKAARKPVKSFEETLWDTANKLRGSVESSEYKHVVLSLIFLKFVSDKFEDPPTGNANYAWILHMVSNPSKNGVDGFVLDNGSMSTNTGGEGEILKKLVENDLVDCMIARSCPATLSTPHRSPSASGSGLKTKRTNSL